MLSKLDVPALSGKTITGHFMYVEIQITNGHRKSSYFFIKTDYAVL